MIKKAILIFLTLLTMMVFSGCLATKQSSQISSSKTIVTINGENFTKDDYSRYKNGCLLYFLELKKDCENSGGEELDKYTNYQYLYSQEMLMKSDEELFQCFLTDIAVAQTAKNYGQPNKQEIEDIVTGMKDAFLDDQTKDTILEKMQVTTEELLEECLPYYVEILYYISQVQTDYIKNIYVPQNGDEMPTDIESEDYYDRYSEWFVSMIRSFAQYKEKIYEEANITVFKDEK